MVDRTTTNKVEIIQLNDVIAERALVTILFCPTSPKPFAQIRVAGEMRYIYAEELRDLARMANIVATRLEDRR